MGNVDRRDSAMFTEFSSNVFWISEEITDINSSWIMKHGCSTEKKGIGGSDAGSICGLNPYSTAISVFQDKTQLQAEEKADNEAMRQGRDLEEYVARRFTEETGKKVRRANTDLR